MPLDGTGKTPLWWLWLCSVLLEAPRCPSPGIVLVPGRHRDVHKASFCLGCPPSSSFIASSSTQ